ncbi:MAG: 50S ribosomal protein L30 [Candidatus Brockarchaeota archaeon]|nr:50S ribosomal protein L30 [Candidatus Brockarchaeota archaeon]
MAVVRVRGTVNVTRDVATTLSKLRLLRVNSSTLVRLTPSIEGMLQKAKDYLMWGRIDKNTLRLLLLKRGRLPGNKRLSDENLLRYTRYKSLDELVEAVWVSDSPSQALKPVKPVFRLTPPKGGFKKSVKKPVKKGGILGDWGERINSILKRMV